MCFFLEKTDRSSFLIEEVVSSAVAERKGEKAMPILPTFARRLLIFACLCLTTPIARGDGWEATVSPFSLGSFPPPRPLQVRYNFGWGGFSAASADVRMEKLGNGRFRFDATARTTGLARALWSYDLRHMALTDAQTLRPIRVSDTERIRSKQVATELTFSSEGVTSVREERKGDVVESKTRRFEFPALLSLNSGLLFLRTQTLPDGAVRRVVVYPATSAYLCTLTVLGRERISVPAGSYEAIKLDVQLSRIGSGRELQPYTKFRKATAWISNDADRLLLRVEAQIFIGKVFVDLQSVRFDTASL